MSIRGFPEPKTEDEAQRMKRFLERGAETTLRELERSAAGGSTPVTLARPGTLTFQATGEAVLRSATVSSDRLLRLRLVVIDLVDAERIYATAFVNAPVADQKTGLDDPAFAGSISFFTASSEHSDSAQPLRYDLDVLGALRRSTRLKEPVSVKLVAHPHAPNVPQTAGFVVREAALIIFESTVKLPF